MKIKKIKKIYNKVLEKILSTISISEIVVNKIHGFTFKQIFWLMKRELKSIVYLLALLGFFDGSYQFYRLKRGKEHYL